MRSLALVLVLASVLATPAAEPLRRGIVSLAPNLTELVYAMGLESQLVARSSACDYPPAATNLPIAGDFGRPNLEVLTRLKPQTILVTDVENPAILQRLRADGASCLKVSCEGWTNLLNAAREIGRAVDQPELAAAWCRGMEQRRRTLQARTDAAWQGRARPRVYVEIWHDPPMTAGGGSFLDDLVALAGGRNAAHELAANYTRASDEWVLRTDPDAIVLLYMTTAGRDAGRELAHRTGWASLRAVRAGNLCAGIPPELLLRPGPRCLDGVEQLATWLETHVR